MWCATHECADAQAERDLTDKGAKHILMSNVEFHVLCVEVGLDLGCRASCRSVSPRRRNTKYRVLFLFDIVVQLCTCSQTVFCDLQFSSVAKLLHTSASRRRVI